MAFKYDENFIETHKRKAKRNTQGKQADEQTPILFFHTMEDGEINWQGYLFELNEDGTGLAVLFSWFHGCETDTIQTTKAFLTECVFYSTAYEMNKAAERANRRDDRKERAA
jgi:hypothetical protein